MQKLGAVLATAMLAWTLAVYDRDGGLVFAGGGYASEAACDAAGAARKPPGGRWACRETKTYRPQRGW